MIGTTGTITIDGHDERCAARATITGTITHYEVSKPQGDSAGTATIVVQLTPDADGIAVREAYGPIPLEVQQPRACADPASPG